MTFEKLKISVGLSLVLFIFIVGNVLAFGFLQKIYDANHLNNKPQNNQPDLNTIIADTRKNNKEAIPSTTITANEENQKKDTVSQTSQTTKRTMRSTIKHKKHHRRTRAS
jgi:hypothetical protein